MTLFFPIDDPDYTLPRNGDKLLIPIPDREAIFSYSKINDYAGQYGDGYYYVITEGYKNSCLILLKSLLDEKEDGLLIDSLIFPLFYNFRHLVELNLKNLIRLKRILRHEATFEEMGFEAGHRLRPLWDEIEDDILPDVANDVSKYFYLEGVTAFSELIQELDTIDRDSFAFRYPYNKPVKGTKEPTLALQKLNVDIKNLKSIMLRMMTQLQDIEFYYSGHIDTLLLENKLEINKKGLWGF